MSNFAVGTTTAALGTDIRLTCPPRGILVPVLRGITVTTGAQEQFAYVMTPLGIGWTKSYTANGDTSSRLNSLVLCDNPDGTPRTIAADELVALTTEHAAFHTTPITSVPSGGDLTVVATNGFTWTEDTIDTFDGTLFRINDVNGSDADPKQHCGVHFASVAIANGATIEDAKLRFYRKSSDSGASSTDVTTYVEDVDDAANPTTILDINPDTQTDTEDGRDFTASQYYEFDVTSGIQTIVNRGGWSSGNSINCYVKLDAITNNDPSNGVTWDDVGDTNEPELVVTASGGVSWTDAPTQDVPYGSLVYYYGDPTDAVHTQLRFPANATTTYRNLCVQGGIGTQKGKLAPASGRGVPMLVVVTNSVAAATVDQADFDWIDPPTLRDEGLAAIPTGRSAVQFPIIEEL